MYGDHMSGWGWTMMVFWLSIWIGLLGILAYAAIGWARGASSKVEADAGADKTARELLDERLARGEIDTDEHRRRRSALEGHQPVGTAR